MKKSSGAKRVPRRIGGDDEDEAPSSGTAAGSDGTEAPSFVKRPFNKSRKSASLRTSFGLSTDDGDDNSGSGVVTPKRTTLNRVAVQRNAERNFAADVPFRNSRDVSEERPSYSKDVLAELRDATPSTPVDASITPSELTDEEPSTAVDLASKFGSDLSRYENPTAIPTDAQIQEKKARRARLAKEKDFISLDAAQSDEELDDNVTRDDSGRLVLKPKDKYPETRLVRDDEDVFEGYEEFTTEGRIALGTKAEKVAEQQRRAEMASLIADAEAASDDAENSDDSDLERNAAFEVAQTRSGTYATRGVDEQEAARPHTPPKITPLPTMEAVMARLRERLQDMQVARTAKAHELEMLRAERVQIEAEEVRVQAALKETADKFAQVRQTLAVGATEEAEQSLEVVPAGNGNTASDVLMAAAGNGGGGLGFRRASTSSDSSFERPEDDDDDD